MLTHANKPILLMTAFLSLFVAACGGGGAGGSGGTGGDGANGGGGSGAEGGGGNGANGGGGSGAEGGGGSAAVCGGLGGVACDDGAYCDYPDEAMCGADDSTGTCQPKPEACQEDCPGVCGCDGQFYCNDCIAASQGVDVDPLASCAPPGTVCGGLGNPPCEDGLYCDYPDTEMCGAADGTGTCEPKPESCDKDCPGVCSCDGQFFCNSCLAAQAGIDVAAGDTSCFPPPGENCGGLAGLVCGPAEYCDWSDVSFCGFTDQLGTCQPRPEVCPQDCPGVCGCDGAFYCNACIAASQGVDVHQNIDCSP
jgi:hypothetical protein